MCQIDLILNYVLGSLSNVTARIQTNRMTKATLNQPNGGVVVQNVISHCNLCLNLTTLFCCFISNTPLSRSLIEQRGQKQSLINNTDQGLHSLAMLKAARARALLLPT